MEKMSSPDPRDAKNALTSSQHSSSSSFSSSHFPYPSFLPAPFSSCLLPPQPVAISFGQSHCLGLFSGKVTGCFIARGMRVSEWRGGTFHRIPHRIILEGREDNALASCFRAIASEAPILRFLWTMICPKGREGDASPMTKGMLAGDEFEIDAGGFCAAMPATLMRSCDRCAFVEELG